MTNFVAVTTLNVAVTLWALPPMLKLHGVVVPEHDTPPVALLQPAKTDPTPAVAASVPWSLFPIESLQVPGDEHNRLFPESSVSVICTWPLPVPAKVTAKFLAAAL